MTQEDGFIEVQVNLYNKTPLLKWVRPVIIKKLKLLFDTYCMVIVSRESGLDFSEVQDMDPDESLAWVVYGAYKSYAALQNRRPRVHITTAVEWVKGMLPDERLRMAETYKMSKEIGSIAESYQIARDKDPDGEADGVKKVEGSVQQN